MCNVNIYGGAWNVRTIGRSISAICCDLDGCGDLLAYKLACSGRSLGLDDLPKQDDHQFMTDSVMNFYGHSTMRIKYML
jgi:hypothetical protein